ATALSPLPPHAALPTAGESSIVATRSSISPSEMTAPPLSNCSTSASGQVSAASATWRSIRSASTGSISPSTSTTITRSFRSGHGPWAAPGAATTSSPTTATASAAAARAVRRRGPRARRPGRGPAFATARLVIVAGKGGVGKTTVSATLARAAALAGLSTLVVEVEGRSGLASMFGQGELGYEEVVLSPGGGPDGAADVRARTLTADAALLEYLEDHGMSRISRRLVATGALDVVATAAPGIKDILLLGKVKQLERAGVADLIVLDAPAAGHAITFLQSARSLLDTVSVGPINAQARDVLELLEDHRRCQVVLVTIPEETPVNEAIETAFSLEDRVGVGLGPIVVNGVYPPVE